mmetsp:Transcript_39318/g.69161  ORF Transcript_39318/g.69161 Transcript_39318/m.69161 type:complete len:269 (-) Transcript_39318:36-842(-)
MELAAMDSPGISSVDPTSFGLSRSASAPMPKLDPNACKHLYEVCSGVVIMHADANVQSAGLGMLRAGARFYATPYQVGRSTWLLLQTEGVNPPVFSHRHAEIVKDPSLMLPQIAVPRKFETRHAPVADARSLRLYTQSAPQALFQNPALAEAEEVWVKMDEQCVVQMRKANPKFGSDIQLLSPTNSMKRRRAPADRQMGEMSFEAENFNMVSAITKASVREASLRSSVPDKDRAAWSKTGPGGWCNFRQYGVSRAPPNDNCGRWRQLN